MIFELPYPPAVLNPNRKVHWGKKHKAFQAYKADCYMLAKQHPRRMEFSVDFYPPDKRKRDIDNAIASFKAGMDGMAQAWGVDDSQFKPHFAREFKQPVRHGKVVVS